MERTDKLNQLRQFNRPWEYDCCDIAEKLVELSNLPDDGQLKNELTDALYYLKAVAENPYNSDYHRVLFNVLLVIHYYFDCCRSVAYRKYASEVRKINRKLAEFAKAYGFQEYVCTARFSNGEAWYQLASNPRARLKSVVA